MKTWRAVFQLAVLLAPVGMLVPGEAGAVRDVRGMASACVADGAGGIYFDGTAHFYPTAGTVKYECSLPTDDYAIDTDDIDEVHAYVIDNDPLGGAAVTIGSRAESFAVWSTCPSQASGKFFAGGDKDIAFLALDNPGTCMDFADRFGFLVLTMNTQGIGPGEPPPPGSGATAFIGWKVADFD